MRVGGVHSGTVRNIVLPHRPGEKVTVFMDMGKSTHEIIKQDSVATIETEGLLGNQFLAISFGSAGSGEVRDGDMIASQAPLEMADLLQKTSGILDSSQQAVQNATRAAANLDSISAKIDRGQGTAGALVNDKQLYTNLEQTTGAMHETMVEAQAGVTDFQENMEAMKHNFFLRGYFKSRGYEDSAELAKNEIERLPQGTPTKEFITDEGAVRQARFGQAEEPEISDRRWSVSNRQPVWLCRRRSVGRYGRRHAERLSSNRSSGHGSARIPGRKVRIR